MAYCTDLLQDVSHHSLHSLLQKQSVSISYVGVGFLFLQSEIYFCFIIKSILKRFAAILLDTKATS